MDKELSKNLETVASDVQIKTSDHSKTVITTKKESVLSVLSFLKDKGFEHLALVSCVDRMDENEFEVVYILSAYMKEDSEYTQKEKENIILKTRIPRKNPEYFTAIHVFKNAEPYEREIHELYGINFEGHPRQIPLLLVKEYEIPPFRKDFDTREYVKNVFDNIPFVEE